MVEGPTRPMACGFSAAADGRAITIDRACALVAATATAAISLISWDPAATIANRITTPTDGQLSSILCTINTGTGSPQVILQLNIPLSAGEVIYLSRSAAGVVMLFFVDTV